MNARCVIRYVCTVYCLAGSELHKLGALKLLTSLLGDVTELAASHCVLTLTHMASYGGLAPDIIQLNIVHSLVALLAKAQYVKTLPSNLLVI